MPAEVLVDVQQLVKTFGPLRAVNDLTFQVRKGEIVGLLGANGAGKSTLMKVLTCFLVADKGTATVAGLSIDEKPLEVRKHIGYLPENAPLYTEMRVSEFLEFVGRMRGLGKKTAERIAWSVEACGLAPKFRAPIRTLSRGFRQRVGIAQAILHDPDLLILDEPTSGLDPIQLIEIRRLIMDIGKTKTVFFSTHIMQEVEAVCTRALIIAKGQLVADGSPFDLKQKFAEKGRVMARVRGATKADVEAGLKDLSGVRGLTVNEVREQGLVEVTLRVGSGEGTSDPKLLNEAGERFLSIARHKGWQVLEVRNEGQSLEDAFLQATLASGMYNPEPPKPKKETPEPKPAAPAETAAKKD